MKRGRGSGSLRREEEKKTKKRLWFENEVGIGRREINEGKK